MLHVQNIELLKIASLLCRFTTL